MKKYLIYEYFNFMSEIFDLYFGELSFVACLDVINMIDF